MLLCAPDCGELQHSLPVLQDSPCAAVPLDPQHGQAYPALGWQLPATKAALQQIAHMPQWLQVSRRSATALRWKRRRNRRTGMLCTSSCANITL